MDIDSDHRRAPIQKSNGKPAGTIDWAEHVEAWRAYNQRYTNRQTAERIAERAGFGYGEIATLLGHEPLTWVANT